MLNKITSPFFLKSAMLIVLMSCNDIYAQETDTNVSLGIGSLNKNEGTHNVAVGRSALEANTSGRSNIAVGTNALNDNTFGSSNVSVGVKSLEKNTDGSSNVAIGELALNSNTLGSNNTAVGKNASRINTTGGQNVALGQGALQFNSTGSNNIAIGYGAGGNIFERSNNIFIGNNGSQNDSGTIRIGTNNTHTLAYMAGVHSASAISGIQVYVTSSGKLGTVTSSARFKKNVSSLEDTTAKLLQLRPVSYIYKEDEDNNLQYGLIAEEVAEIYPELIEYDTEGNPLRSNTIC